MADEKDILEQLIDARMASKKELDNLKLGKDRPLAASIRDRMGMTGDLAENMVPDKELSSRMSGASTIDDLAKPISKQGSRVANKAEGSMLSKLGRKIGGKGLGKVAAGLAGLPLLLASEAADASEVGESVEDENMMIAEAQGRKDYSRSPARADKLDSMGRDLPEQSNKDYFKELRAIKDQRSGVVSDRLEENGDQEIKDMLDVKEDALDRSQQNLSREERERIASDHAKKQREKRGLNPNASPDINQGKKL